MRRDNGGGVKRKGEQGRVGDMRRREGRREKEGMRRKGERKGEIWGGGREEDTKGIKGI